jgi:hypothetical protein
MAGQSSQAHLDHAARQLGFHDYATYSAYQQKQTRNGIGIGNRRARNRQQPRRRTNWLQHLMESIPGHPAQLLKYVGDKFGAATGQ